MSFYYDAKKEEVKSGKVVSSILFGLTFIIALSLWGCPQYVVWQQGLSGKAEFTKAEYNRKVSVLEAEAKFESSKMLAKAEIERARGVAEANKIIGSSLKDHEEYLKYLWITNLHNPNKEVIYVPTEAMIPVMEAGRAIKSQIQ